VKAGPDERRPEPAKLDPERGGLHRLVLKAMAIVLLVATASLLGTNLYFHVLGYLGGTAHMRDMFGLVISTIAAIFLMKVIERFSGGEGISDCDLPRGLRWARRTVTVYGIAAFLVCLFTSEPSRPASHQPPNTPLL
jgi:hypothetical protein